MAIPAIIVDDEPKGRNTLRNLVQTYCPDLEILAEAETVQEAVKMINKNCPGLVFLDIELPQQNGFHLFDFFEEPDFEVIFTTAYNQYAVKAFRMSAADYPLKPIDIDELKEAVRKVIEKRASEEARKKLQTLKSNFNEQLNKLALPSLGGYVFVDIDEIIRCEADRNYTVIHLVNNGKHTISKTLKFFEEVLEELQFIRVNRSSIINLRFVLEYAKSPPASIKLLDGHEVSLSESRKKEFLDHFHKLG